MECTNLKVELYHLRPYLDRFAWLNRDDQGAEMTMNMHDFTAYASRVIAKDWECPTFRWMSIDRPLPDNTNIGAVLTVWSRRAVDILHSFLTNVDILPISVAPPYYLIRPPKVPAIEVINCEESSISWADRRVSRMSNVYYWIVNENVVKDLTIFEMTGMWGTYVTKPIVDAVESYGLVGFNLEKVYPPQHRRPQRRLP